MPLMVSRRPWLSPIDRAGKPGAAAPPVPWTPESLGANLKWWHKRNTGLTTRTARQFTIANTEYLTHSDNAAFQLSGGFIIAAWIYYDADTLNHQNIICRGSGPAAGNLSYRLAISNTERALVEISNGSSLTTVTDTGTGILNPGTWYFLCAWYKPSTTTLRLRVNANTVVQSTSAVALANGSLGFAIGAETDGGRPWGGRIQSAVICKIADPESVISDFHAFFYNSGNGRLPSELSASQISAWGVSAAYNLDEPSGNAIDAVGSLDLTDTNTVTANDGKVARAIVDGDTVYEWADQSGNGYTCRQATYAKRPVYDSSGAPDGGSRIIFDGVDDWLPFVDTSNILSTDSFEIAVCGDAGGATQAFHARTNTNYSGLYSSTHIYNYVTADRVNFSPITDSTVLFGSYVEADADIFAYAGSGSGSPTPLGSDTSVTVNTGMGRYGYGADANGANGFLAGYITEAFACSGRTLTSDERGDADAYLGDALS